ncbi:MAG: O-antigen ligase family protein [Candidatus Kuenenbacteria bacterium]
MKQFPKNGIFLTTMLFLIFFELLSIFAWGLPEFNGIVFGVIVLLTFVLSLKKLEYGIYIAIAELIIGSHGYLFSLSLAGGETLISIRMGIFAMVMLAWAIRIGRIGEIREYWGKIKEFKFLRYYIFLGIILVWGFVWGIIRGNNFGNVFLDFNNWLFFLYLLPMVSIADKIQDTRYKIQISSNNQETTIKQSPVTNHQSRIHDVFWQTLAPVVLAALSWLIIKTLILLYIFSHQFLWALPEVYQWIRDTRVGEITMMSNNFYRIFLQSQVYALLGFFILLTFSQLSFRPKRIERSKRSGVEESLDCDSNELISSSNSQGIPRLRSLIAFAHFARDDIKTKLLLVGCLAAVIISFSRSFWIGLAGGLCVYFLYKIYELRITNYKLQFRELTKQILKLLTIAIISVGIIFAIINLPPKISGESFASLISKRTTQIEAAGSSRINMLKPLLKSIAKHPIIGSGFGTTVTYRSVDPRILTATAGASGEYTTYAFEWAYLDLLLKVGLAGLIVYFLLIFKILQRIWQQVKKFCSVRVSWPRYCGGRDSDAMKNVGVLWRETPTGQNLTIKQSNNGAMANSFFVGLMLALLSLLIVNIFTPYLNHPLGIGVVILISVFVSQDYG